jgi:site-specific DNA-methyltransferase (adenine-specific)
MAGLGDFRSEQIGEATLYLGNSLEVLPHLGEVGAIITDPPYEARMQMLHAETRLRRKDGGPQRKDLNFDSIADIREPFLDEVARINTGWLLAFCNVEGVGDWQASILERDLKFKTTCIWNKPDATPKLNGQGPALSYECITSTWCGSGHARWNGGGKRGMFTHLTNNKDRHGTHPTEKPVSLMNELVYLFTFTGDLVLDPFMGSGTTGVSCAKLGRKFIGIEQNEEYFNIAVSRIRAAYAQPDMFIVKEKEVVKQMDLLAVT